MTYNHLKNEQELSPAMTWGFCHAVTLLWSGKIWLLCSLKSVQLILTCCLGGSCIRQVYADDEYTVDDGARLLTVGD
jgi:hypothetical protein